MKYTNQGIKQMFAKPKWYYFLPIVGYFIMFNHLQKNEKAAGILTIETPGGRYIAGVTKKFFIYQNIFFIVTFVVTLVTILPQWLFWKKHILKAVNLNEQANLY